MPTRVPSIDRAKLRAWIRRGGDNLTFSLLDDAIDLLPAAKLARLVSSYIQAERLAPDDPLAAGTRTPLADVADFDARSRAGQYYQDFAGGLVENGETIEDYPDDVPFPSRLVGDTASGRLLHAVVAVDGSRCVVITTYESDPAVRTPDGRTSKKA